MSKPSPEPIKIKPKVEWDEKCHDCPVAGILINKMSDPKYNDKTRAIIFHFIKDALEDITGDKYEF